MNQTSIWTQPQRHRGFRFSAQFLTQLGIGTILVLVFVASAAATAYAPQLSGPAASPVLLRQPNPSRTPSPTATAPPTRALTARTSPPRAASSAQSVPGQPQVDANTVVLYHFDTPDTVAVDATGNYTGTLVGNATILDSGLYAGVLYLDGNNSYVQIGNLGSMPQGTIEAFVDFSQTCNHLWDLTILSAGGPLGSNQTTLWLGAHGALMFGIYDGTTWHYADSGITACRYLTQGGTTNPFPWQNIPVRWPYETWRFHHVAGTWGPRGMEIWVDGVLHGVGTTYPDTIYPPKYKCIPQDQEASPIYPVCTTPVPAPQMTPEPPPGDYYGGLAPSPWMIGCDQGTQGGLCFTGRIDEVRISNIQRTFEWTVVPTVTPVPTWTPIAPTGQYAVDQYTRALYHLNFSTPQGVLEEVSQSYHKLNNWGAYIVPNGKFNAGLYLDGASSVALGNGAPGNQGTIEAWVNFTSASAGQPIIADAEYNGSARSLLYLGPLSSSTLGFSVYDGTNQRWVDSGVSPASLAGCWHHIAGTFGPRGLEIWIDGSLRKADPTYTGAMYWSNDLWQLGCDTRGNCMKGIVDEVRISSIQRFFVTPSHTSRASAQTPVPQSPNLQAPRLGQNLTFLPMIEIAPIPVCPFGP